MQITSDKESLRAEGLSREEINDPDLLPRIRRYWDERAQGFSKTRAFELAGPLKARWSAEIEPEIRALQKKAERPFKRKIEVLDVGTGTGFLAILAAELGARVVGADLSSEMVAAAEQSAQAAGVGDETLFITANAERIPYFGDERFDLIVSRNLVWTLPSPAAAYREWQRLLRPGGRLVIFDADYGAVSFAKLTASLEAEGVENAHEGIQESTLDECDAIKAQLAISAKRRPAWDAECLAKLGFKDIETDEKLSSRIYLERDEAWNPVPMFVIRATKPERE